VLTYKMAIALRPQICDVTSPYVLRFFVVYRPPNNDVVTDQYLSLLVDCLTVYTSGTQANTVVDDLNCPKIDWPAASCSGVRV